MPPAITRARPPAAARIAHRFCLGAGSVPTGHGCVASCGRARMAARTRSGVAGIVRTRVPMARDSPLMIAGVVGSIGASASPLTPSNPSRLGDLDDMDIHLRHGPDRRHVIVVEPTGRAGEMLFHERRAESHEDRSLDLPAHFGWIDRVPDVVRGCDAPHARYAGPPMHLDECGLGAGDKEWNVFRPVRIRELLRQVQDPGRAP